MLILVIVAVPNSEPADASWSDMQPEHTQPYTDGPNNAHGTGAAARGGARALEVGVD